MSRELVTLGREYSIKRDIMDDGQIQVRTDVSIYDGDTLIARGTSRKVIEPGEDTSKEPPQIQALTAFIHSPDVVEKFQLTKQAKLEEATRENKIK